tara:strand:+ start:873 stop:1130 length:258 start_codon:yes stop_codon:yes gene_type:complete
MIDKKKLNASIRKSKKKNNNIPIKEPKNKTVAWMQQRKNMEQKIINLHKLLDNAHTPDVDAERELDRLEQRWLRIYGKETWRNKL